MAPFGTNLASLISLYFDSGRLGCGLNANPGGLLTGSRAPSAGWYT